MTRSTSLRPLQRFIHDLFEASVLTLAVGHVGSENQARSAGPDAVAQRLRAKTRKHHGVNCANAHRCQHQDDGFGTGRHVDREAIALIDAHAAQCRRHPLHFVKQLGISEDALLAAFIEIDQSRVPAPAALHVIVEGIVGEIRLRADEPLEGRRSPVQHSVPLAKPRQLVRRASPKSFGVLLPFIDPLLHYRIDQAHCFLLFSLAADSHRPLQKSAHAFPSGERQIRCREFCSARKPGAVTWITR